LQDYEGKIALKGIRGFFGISIICNDENFQRIFAISRSFLRNSEPIIKETFNQFLGFSGILIMRIFKIWEFFRFYKLTRFREFHGRLFAF
jgi:hypothetical protein